MTATTVALPPVSFRVFLAAALILGTLHFRYISSQSRRLGVLQAEIRKCQESSAGNVLGEVESLRAALADRRAAMASDVHGKELLAQLAILMNKHSLNAPAIRTGSSLSAFGFVQSSFEVSFKGSLPATVAFLADLLAGKESWSLFRFSIEHGPAMDPTSLSVNAEVRTLALAEREGA